MNLAEHWKWLVNFADILEHSVEKMDASSEPKLVVQLRLAERTLNMCIDDFTNMVYDSETGSISDFFHDQSIDMKAWYELKDRRDAIANRLSTIIEANPKIEEHYIRSCEALKNHRSIDALL